MSIKLDPNLKKKTIVVVAFNAVGHINGCAGAAKVLLDKGHRVIFLLEKSFQGMLKSMGYEEVVYELPKEFQNKKPGQKFAENLIKFNVLANHSIEERLNVIFNYLFQSDLIEPFYQAVDECLRRLLQEIQIDLFINDDALTHPAIYYSKIPVVKCITGQPSINAMDDALPPPYTGIPSNADPKIKQHYWKILQNSLEKFMNQSSLKEFFQKLGYKMINQTEMKQRDQLTIYAIPKELNHWKIESYHDWHNMEAFNKTWNKKDNECLTLKELVGEKLFNDNLQGNFSGKWIYLSLGSMVSIDLKLMNKLTSILARTNHKFIVSKGARHAEYELPSNMWGDQFVSQLQILPLIDLVITHGGNNTVTETFSQGKPMIVMPCFCDQFDNAQRLVETKFGARIDPFNFDEQELIDTIDKLLYDQQLQERLTRAANRIQHSNSHELFAQKAEIIMDNYSKVQ